MTDNFIKKIVSLEIINCDYLCLVNYYKIAIETIVLRR